MRFLINEHFLDLCALYFKFLCYKFSDKNILLTLDTSVDFIVNHKMSCVHLYLKYLPSINVCKKWLLIHAGENAVLSASRKTTQTISFPIWRFLCSFWASCFSYGRRVDTWNIISIPRQFVYTEYKPVKSCTVSKPPLYLSKPET